MFEILGMIIEYFFSIIPRFHICKVNEVVMKHKGLFEELKISHTSCFYWPCVTEIEIWDMAEQVSGGNEQKCMTKDERSVSFEVIFHWKNVNPKKSQIHFGEEPLSVIQNYIINLSNYIVSTNTLKDIRSNLKKISSFIEESADKKFRPYGRVINVAFVSLIEVTPIMHIGGAEFSHIASSV